MRVSARPSTRPGRRRALGAAVIGAALLAVAACGQGSNPADPDADTGADANAAGDGTGADGEQVTIRFAWWGNPDRAEITNAAVDAFMTANPDVLVETDSIDFESYFDRLATSVAAGDEPDVITMGGAYPREYGARGVLADLDSLSEHLDTSVLDESALANGYFEDVQYGVPTGVNTYGLIINPDLFNEAGVDIPDDEVWDWSDFVDVAHDLAAGLDGDTYAIADPTAAETMDLYASQQSGLGLYTHEGDLNLTADHAAEWWEMTLGLMHSGAAPSASLTSELSAQGAPEQSLLGRGQGAMMFGWSNQLAAFAGAVDADLQMLRVPGETNHERPGMWLQASQLYTISAGSDHPEAAARLVDFLVSAPEAAEHIGADRGIPANSDIRTYLIDQGLEPVQEAEFAFIDRISEVITGDFVIGPTGSTETAIILTRLNDSVLFEQLTPQEAGEQLVTEVSDAIS